MISNKTMAIGLLVLGWMTISASVRWLRARYLLQEWARKNGYVLVKVRVNWLGLGPYVVVSNRQEVFRIRARDRHGRERNGSAICGGIFLGLLVNTVEVEWD